MTKRLRSKKSGATMVEAVIAATLTVMTMTVTIMSFLQGMQTWVNGQGQLDADVNAQQVVRRLSQEFREAMSVTVDANGLGLSYRLPARDANGRYTVPPTWDGIERRCYLVNDPQSATYNLWVGPVGSARKISSRVVLNDPESVNNGTYRPFTAGPGSVTRELIVMLVTRGTRSDGHWNHSRVRETLVLRNVPATTR